MDPAPKAKPGVFEGLTKILHLHQLPATNPKAGISTLNQTESRAFNTPIPPVDVSPQSVPTRSTPVTPPSPSPPKEMPRPVPTARASTPPASPPSSRSGAIVTDYDRILDLVRTRGSMKLDEIARLLALPEEPVAQELQTLEDNGLVEVKYPAFGEPVIFYKKPEGTP